MTMRRWLWIATIAVALVMVGTTVAELRDHVRPTTPRRDENSVSLADVAGSNIVALTVAPPKPGHVRLRVDIVGLNPADTTDVVLDATSTGGTHASAHVHSCGIGCFVGTTKLGGGDSTWTFTVRGRTSSGSFAIRLTTPLPAADARTALADTLARMNRLRSLRVIETLQARERGPVLDTEYRFQAPNRFAYDQTRATHARTIAIGTRQYERDTPKSPWHVATWPDPAGFAWPANFYNAFWTPATAVRALGPALIRRTPTHVIAFVRSDTDAWFRIWIGDRDGLVHRMEMRARSHIMNQSYRDFDQPITITAPRS
jgi:hypothetical protein